MATSFESFQPVKQVLKNRSPTHERCHMRKEYDFTAARKNPYAAQLKKQITIRLDEESINYFKVISQDAGIPYQSLINLYLRDCATSHRKLNLNWS
ncbi:BrnA antitoxin family protein [Rhodoferax sp.]|uniref:BrnA antitoxin family protein n=2 Tax=Rhodoferax sp. TaxID=50421 RepID=UPI003BB6497A